MQFVMSWANDHVLLSTLIVIAYLLVGLFISSVIFAKDYTVETWAVMIVAMLWPGVAVLLIVGSIYFLGDKLGRKLP